MIEIRRLSQRCLVKDVGINSLRNVSVGVSKLLT